jgi:hypothetical protein
MSEVREIVASVYAARTAVLDAVCGLSPEQAAFRLSENDWSTTQILEHLVLAEMSTVSRIWAAAERAQGGEPWQGSLPNQGRSIEEIVAATWQPREQACEPVSPRLGGSLNAWISALRSLQWVLQDLATAIEDVDLGSIVLPNILSGPLDARQRLEFLRLHLQRHLSQINRLKANKAFPRGYVPGAGEEPDTMVR